MQKMEIRWAQLDLARQMETLEYIEKFICLLENSGYNGLLLYLEDRVRTASYPYPADNECYTEDEIRHLVEFGLQHNIELIPCVATLGHAERFLRHAELESLSEVREGVAGRFGGKDKNVFCISNPGFYKFIETYIKEVAILFPSKWFHVGLDEFFDYNLCPDCKKLMPDLASEQEMFLRHILKMHSLTAGLGKRMIMWSDMFEIYADIYKDVPADVVMMDWLYDLDVRTYIGHLLDCGKENRLAVNHACGHDTIIAPVDNLLNNSQSYLEYANGKPGVIGALITSWEKTDIYQFRCYPCFVVAGLQMNGMNRDEAFEKMVADLFGTDDKILSSALHAALNNGMMRHFNGVSEFHLFKRGYYGLDIKSMDCDLALRNILEASIDKVNTPLGKRCLSDLIDAYSDKVLSHKAKRIIHEIFDFGATPKRLSEFTAFRGDYRCFLDKMEELWSVYRSGITPNKFTECKGKINDALVEIERKLSLNSYIRIGGSLPDYYGIEYLDIEYHTPNGWVKGFSGMIKDTNALFSIFIPVDISSDCSVDMVKLTAHGMGGIGITFVEIVVDGKVFIPEKIHSTANMVRDPEFILADDTNFAWFGGQSVRNDYFDSAAAQCRHECVIEMKMVEYNDLIFCKRAGE